MSIDFRRRGELLFLDHQRDGNGAAFAGTLSYQVTASFAVPYSRRPSIASSAELFQEKASLQSAESQLPFRLRGWLRAITSHRSDSFLLADIRSGGDEQAMVDQLSWVGDEVSCRA